MQLDTPPKRIFAAPSSAKENMEIDDSDPFISVSPERSTQQSSRSFDLRLPKAASAASTSLNPSLSTPVFAETPSHQFQAQTHFSTAQPTTHPLLREFSYSWEEAAALHDVNPDLHTGLGKSEAKKRLSSDAFEAKRAWEIKRFRRAGCDLRRWGKGDFGPKVGVGRL
ncbi:hypothetical protein PtrSN002B_006108 [Pyrenophora tritici-repentis]|nr:hypothetical protein A1F99_000940 [Pyrenophora tritici-repentis]KAI1549946.1 hypothetical protein PtrSN002B_006108 [Pyrenophora tritici-repentis]KAI1563719.1 hypothetical protein PtrEW4_009252 [Pyrenophora tritici-repentis]KAI1567095.1 hypothetical protein PtrEW7m1_009321 [Pyrenophora tritici-repentis]KAI1597034.1 hypothetical protein PtrCC142_009179 [Pyrenophora tritici-repentis]